MSNNSVNNLLIVSLIVSFKGKVHNFKAQLDLDKILRNNSKIPPLHDWIARVNKVDSYSYLFEVLQSETVIIEDATGLAADFVKDNQFDSAGFIKAWRQENALHSLNHFAQTHLNENLDKNPALKQALLDAFNYGFTQGQEQPSEA